MTKTAAYNANEVAAVYMSLNRNDLLSSDEGGNKLQSGTSLENGFFGLSDPLNSRGFLESFEANFERGKNSSTYKIRILNPTTELESTLIGFYDNVFPSDQSTFKAFKGSSEKESRMTAVEDKTGDQDTAFLDVNAPPQLPRIYLRFGYGTTSEQGLSRIHKAIVSDIKYIVSDKKDKVIELACVDLYTFSKLNPSFNKRPYVSRVSVLDTVDGELSLRKPSQILANLFAKYTNAYPGCIPIIDLGGYVKDIDNLTYSVAYALAEGDKISQEQAKENDEEPKDFSSVAAKPLSASQVEQVTALIDRPLNSTTAIDRQVKGKVTQQILFQAYKMIFEQLGLVWEINPVDSPEPINGPLAQNQTDAVPVPTDISSFQAASQKREQKNATLTPDLPVNLQTDLLHAGFYPQLTSLANRAGANMLSFWPMGFSLSSGELRKLTMVEKSSLMNGGHAPLWVDAGMVNPKNYLVNSYVNDDKTFKYDFTVGDLTKRGQLPTFGFDNPAALWGGEPMPVSIPVLTVDNQDTAVFTGPQSETFIVPGETQIPVIDLDLSSGGYLYPISKYNDLPSGEFREWGRFASGTLIAAAAPGVDDAVIPGIADNPPLLNLEPTTKTVQFLGAAAVAYQEEVAKQIDESEVEEEKAMEEGNIASPENAAPDEEITLDEDSEWNTQVAEMSNAYISMGDSAESPHISMFLQKIINNLNRIIIGRNSKLMVQPLQVNTLSPEDRETLSKTSVALRGYDWEDDWVKKDSVILIIGTESDITAQYADPLIRPILSFPQVLQEKIEEGGASFNLDPDVEQEYTNQMMWLDYGTPDSLIAKLDFTGDIRVLVNLAQSNFASRQWNDVKKLFDGTETLSKDMITNVISRGLAIKIAELNAKVASQGSEQTESQLAQQQELTRLNNLVKTGAESSDALIDQELLSIFPSMVASFETDEALAKVVGKKSQRQMKVLASLVGNPKTLNMLFPEAQIEGRTNKMRSQAIVVGPDKVEKMDMTVPVLQRKVDFDQIHARISALDTQNKLSDVSFNFVAAMQQESFTLKLTTLGIPEIDNPAQEFLSRYIFLRFYDPRLANGSLHWLSGVYKMTGFKHVINPSQGFLTELSILRLANNEGDIQTARDTR